MQYAKKGAAYIINQYSCVFRIHDFSNTQVKSINFATVSPITLSSNFPMKYIHVEKSARQLCKKIAIPPKKI